MASGYLPNSLCRETEGPRVLLGCSGSVATIKVAQLAEQLQQQGASVIVVPTRQALHFLKVMAQQPTKDCELLDTLGNNAETSSLSCVKNIEDTQKTQNRDENNIQSRATSDKKRSIDPIYCLSCSYNLSNNKSVNSSDSRDTKCCDWCVVQSMYPNLTIAGDTLEWEMWRDRGDPVMHIELRRWAQVMLIAPLSANTLAKLANGMCDNLLTCVVRAWDIANPLLFCPAMNTHMYQHPLTARHIASLKEFGYEEVPSVSKLLMCGDVGEGAMAELDTILAAVLRHLTSIKSEI